RRQTCQQTSILGNSLIAHGRPTMMDSLGVEQRRQEIINRYGEWQGENFQLSEDIYTRGKDADVNPYRLQRLVRMITDLYGSFNGLRVLDIGSFEGAHSIEF